MKFSYEIISQGNYFVQVYTLSETRRNIDTNEWKIFPSRRLYLRSGDHVVIDLSAVKLPKEDFETIYKEWNEYFNSMNIQWHLVVNKTLHDKNRPGLFLTSAGAMNFEND